MNHLNFLSRALVAMVTLLPIGIPAFAHDFEVDGIFYNITDENAKTVEMTYQGDSYSSYSNEYSGAVNIPSSVTYNGTTYSVTSISDNVFKGCNELTSVSIPNSVTYIASEAFAGCSGLASVTIPKSVISIGNYAFNGCTKLTKLIIEDGTKPLSLGCNYDGILNYGKGLFYDCPLKSAYLGRNLNYNAGGRYGFSPFYNKDKLNEVTISNYVTTICTNIFRGCSDLTSITIPNSVVTIGGYAFENCWLLTSITIPNSVKTIGNNAFDGCYKLTSLTIGNSVSEIGKSAFWECKGLTSITIPNSVTKIGASAFFGCSGLTGVNILDLTAWCKIKFDSYDANPLWYAQHLFLNGTEIKNLVIPNDITEIKKYAFIRCCGLTILSISNSVTKIGDEAFESCIRLTGELNIPHSVTEIGEMAFYKCYGMTHVTIPYSVTKIGDKAFKDCNLESVTSYRMIPPSCGSYAFDGSYSSILKVRENAKDAYANASEWHKFTNIQEISGVDDIKMDNNAIEVARYDIHGRLLSKPTEGINIVRMSDGTTRKVTIKN